MQAVPNDIKNKMTDNYIMFILVVNPFMVKQRD